MAACRLLTRRRECRSGLRWEPCERAAAGRMAFYPHCSDGAGI